MITSAKLNLICIECQKYIRRCNNNKKDWVSKINKERYHLVGQETILIREFHYWDPQSTMLRMKSRKLTEILSLKVKETPHWPMNSKIFLMKKFNMIRMQILHFQEVAIIALPQRKRFMEIKSHHCIKNENLLWTKAHMTT